MRLCPRVNSEMKSHSIEGKGQSFKGTLHPYSPSNLSRNLSVLIVSGGESLAAEIRLLSNIVEQDGARLVSIKITFERLNSNVSF